MDSILPRLQQIPPGTVIPKPEATGDFTVNAWGKRNSEAALIYNIPNHSDSRKPHQKGVTVAEWEQAYDQLRTTGEFTREWFNAHMHRCSKEGTCNFTTIGGIFSLLGLAAYDHRGVYRKLGSTWHPKRPVLKGNSQDDTTMFSSTSAADAIEGLERNRLRYSVTHRKPGERPGSASY